MDEQVIELRVAPGMLGEVLVNAGEELRLPDPGHQLAKCRSALGVGNAVEVHAHRIEIGHVSSNRVGRGQLILTVRPGLALIGERGPGIGEARGMHVGVVRSPFREGLVEPQVVPPGHGDQIAEPHVSELVQDRVRTLLVGRVSHAGAEDEILEERDAARILHRARVEFGDEELVVLAERVGHAELLLEELEALLGD